MEWLVFYSWRNTLSASTQFEAQAKEHIFYVKPKLFCVWKIESKDMKQNTWIQYLVKISYIHTSINQQKYIFCGYKINIKKKKIHIFSYLFEPYIIASQLLPQTSNATELTKNTQICFKNFKLATAIQATWLNIVKFHTRQPRGKLVS